MKSRSIFWSIFFLTSGLLLLLTDIFKPLLIDAWKGWPILIVLSGLDIILKFNHTFRPLITGALGLYLPIVIFSAVTSHLNTFSRQGWYMEHLSERLAPYHNISDNDSSANKEYSIPFNSSIKKASLKLETAAMHMSVLQDTVYNNSLFYGKASLSFLQHHLSSSIDGDKASLEFHTVSPSNIFSLNFDDKTPIGSKTLLYLHPSIEWMIDAEIGAGKVDFDLSQHHIQSIFISSGASDISIRMSELAKHADVFIETGLSEINIYVPKNVYCKVSASTGLSSTNAIGFLNINDTEYETENKDSANSINITIEAGASSINIERY